MARILLSNAKRVKPEGFKPAKVVGDVRPKNGKVGDYKFVYQTYDDVTNKLSDACILYFDTHQQAIEYVWRMTPVGCQGLLDGISVVLK